MGIFNKNLVNAGLLGILVFVYLSLSVNAATNCKIDSECDNCAAGDYKYVKLSFGYVKVCCPECKKYCHAGNRVSDGRAFCKCTYPEDIMGDCWKGPQCEQCLNGPNKTYVGSINTMPVCCAQCEQSGLILGSTMCYCRHNGP